MLVAVVVAACVGSLRTAWIEQDSLMLTPGSASFGSVNVGSISSNATFSIDELSGTSGTDTISYLALQNCPDFCMVASGFGGCQGGSGSVTIYQNCGSGSAIASAAPVGSGCSGNGPYTFTAYFKPLTSGYKVCNGKMFDSSGSATFTLSGSGVGGPTADAGVPDGPPYEAGDVIGNDGGGPGGNGGKDRQTYYACSTGDATSTWPIALAIGGVMLARRRRRR